MALELWRPKLMARSPFRELARLEREMEDMFGRLPAWPWGERERGWAPAVDMVDRKDEIVLRADLPGLDEKDIEVTVQDGMLTIRGERKEETEEKKGTTTASAPMASSRARCRCRQASRPTR